MINYFLDLTIGYNLRAILSLFLLQAHLKKWFEYAATPQKQAQMKITGQVLSNVSN